MGAKILSPFKKLVCFKCQKFLCVFKFSGHRVSVSKEKGLQKLLLSLLSFPESEHSVCLKKWNKAEKGKHSMVKKSWNAISRKRDQTMPQWMTEKKRKVWLRCLLSAEKKQKNAVLNLQTKSSKRSLSSLPPNPTFNTTKAYRICSPVKSNKITQLISD